MRVSSRVSEVIAEGFACEHHGDVAGAAAAG